MILNFDAVIPHPLKDYQHHAKSIWNRQFSLQTPETILLNAASGKGKSTFANILCGIRHDYDGTIFLDGVDIRSFTLQQWTALRRTKISAVFQDLQLFGELTAWENLLVKNNLCHYASENEISEMMALLGIGDKKNQLAKTLSLGQQQRVAIIRSLLQPFELLIMDEPFSHLDETNASIALELIHKRTLANKAGFILTSLGSKYNFNFDNELFL